MLVLVAMVLVVVVAAAAAVVGAELSLAVAKCLSFSNRPGRSPSQHLPRLADERTESVTSDVTAARSLQVPSLLDLLSTNPFLIKCR